MGKGIAPGYGADTEEVLAGIAKRPDAQRDAILSPGPILKRKPLVEEIETYAQDIVDTVRESLPRLLAKIKALLNLSVGGMAPSGEAAS